MLLCSMRLLSLIDAGVSLHADLLALGLIHALLLPVALGATHPVRGLVDV
jgi:hypothetical protein